jgi:hypothetical protein
MFAVGGDDEFLLASGLNAMSFHQPPNPLFA